MSQSLLRIEREPELSDSLFPPHEGPSFCSRPTPVVDVPESLRSMLEPAPRDVSGIVPRSSPRTDSSRPSSDSLDQVFFEEPKTLPLSLPPPVVRRPPSRARLVVSLTLFVTLFGSAAVLLGLALMRKFGLMF